MSRRTAGARRWRRLSAAGLFLLCVAGLVGAAGPAGANPGGRAAPAQSGGETITSFDSSVTIEATSASVLVAETIVYDFGSNRRRGILRLIPVRFPFDPEPGSRYDDGRDRVRLTPISDVSVSTDPGTPSDLEQTDKGDYVQLRIGEENTYITGRHTYRITYRLKGVFNTFDDHDELYLNITGDQWEVPINRAGAQITAPVEVREVVCYQGPRESRLPCDSSSADGSTARFGADGLDTGSGLTAVLSVAKGTIADPSPILQEQSTIGNAMRPRLGVGLGAGALLLAGLAGVGGLVYAKGRDVRFSGSAVDAAFGNVTGGTERVPVFQRDGRPVEFVPPGGIRPGHMGTLYDEVANPLDVSAMIVDLAVRGYLRIEEVESPTSGVFGFGKQQGDYRFVRRRPTDNSLLSAEGLLLEGIFRDGDQVLLSDLRQQFSERLALVESALYDDTVSQGWFPTRPDRVRARWHGVGVAVTVVGGGLVFLAFRYAVGLVLLAAAVAVVGLYLLAMSGRFPHRTAQGSAMLSRVQGFKELFDVGEGERQAFAESKGLFSRYLPYAIVFGMAERWAGVFKDLGLTPQEMGVGDWYVSPYGYDAFAFSRVMTGFATTTSGSIAMSAPSSSASSGSSGFGGGGFSGGGFGGGGGGSW